MPRYRKLHTKIAESDDVNDMPDDFTRLLWTWLPLACDREGRCLDNPGLVRSKLFPLRSDVTNAMITAAMDWYANRKSDDGIGMIERYVVKGRRYFWLPTFRQHQGDTSRESESMYPAPPAVAQLSPAHQEEEHEQDGARSRPTHDQLATNSGTESSSSTTTSSTATAEAESSSATGDDDGPPPTRLQVLAQEYELLVGSIGPSGFDQVKELDGRRSVPVEWVTDARVKIQERREAGQHIGDPWKYMLAMIADRQRNGGNGSRASPPGPDAKRKAVIDKILSWGPEHE